MEKALTQYFVSQLNLRPASQDYRNRLAGYLVSIQRLTQIHTWLGSSEARQGSQIRFTRQTINKLARLQPLQYSPPSSSLFLNKSDSIFYRYENSLDRLSIEQSGLVRCKEDSWSQFWSLSAFWRVTKIRFPLTASDSSGLGTVAVGKIERHYEQRLI